MGNPTRKDGRIEPGQKLGTAISARAWNRAQDAADIVLGERDKFLSPGQEGPPRASNILLVRNNSGEDVPWLGVLGLGNPVTSTASNSSAQFTSDMVLSGVMPQGGDQAVGVAVEPIAAGAVGRVAISGRFPAKIKILTTAHKYARGRADDVTQLITAECGPRRIVWMGSGTDGVMAAVIG